MQCIKTTDITMDRREEILKMRTQMGYNCAQAALCALEDMTNLDRETAIAVTEGAGGGMRCGEICGALSGAVLALGLICKNRGEPMIRNARVKELTEKLTERFKEREGHLACRDLLAECGHANCNKYIIDAVEIVSELTKE